MNSVALLRPVVCLLVCWCWATLGGASGFGQSGQRPNIILINVDDLDTVSFDNGRASGVLPNLQQLASDGVRFTNCHVTSPLCGPSRASLLTGRYLFEHGVKSHLPAELVSNGFPGGFGQYSGRPSSLQPSVPQVDWRNFEFANLAKQAGYRTMLVGKYMHGDFSPQANQNWQALRPAGWDDFYASLSGQYYNFRRYQSRRNGVYEETVAESANLNLAGYPSRYHPHLQSKYRTNIEFIDSIQLIDQHVTRNPQQPFLLYLAPYGPHKSTSGSMLDQRYESWWPNMRQPWRPDFNMANVAGKPPAVANLPLLDADQMAQADREYRERMLAMKSVDEMLGLLRTYLNETGLAQRTLIIFTSDNGYMLGQQRHLGKQLPYDLTTQVPMVVWGPGMGVARGEQRSHLLSHVDVMPTILELSQASNIVSDGISFRSLWATSGVPSAATWRPSGVLTEHYQKMGHAFQNIEGVCHSVRFHDQRYTRWADGSTEYYDHQIDPMERQNRVNDLSSGERHLFERLLVEFRPETQRFGGTISAPGMDGELFFKRVKMKGYAEAIHGVSEVRLVISRQAQGQTSGSIGLQYFNGTSWQNQFHQVRANLQSPNTSLTWWTYDFTPGGSSEYRIDVTARIYDRAGQFQTSIFRRNLRVETDSIGTSITNPVAPLSVAGRNEPLELRGWTKGEAAIREVRLVIRDIDSGQYFDGAGWQMGYRYVQAPIVFPSDPTYANWAYTLPPDRRIRRIIVSVRGYQTNGVFDLTVATARIDLL
ncbi:MAG: sulfatase-like hydrolase/transferase [Pirellulaceae bacterium]|nr:sulfatase-like hydrolase/transferase [Pirellulaceae bacterium]